MNLYDTCDVKQSRRGVARKVSRHRYQTKTT